ncbi:hypothetical protein B0H13DRAFT_2345430 [Mycena leptocephala]|nr:hypothetical protein B0H13DRAFT_2345430 [Mycena leptocephala]
MTRSSSRKISASITKIAAQDLLDSGEENDMDVDEDADKTLVQSGEEEEDDKDEDDSNGNATRRRKIRERVGTLTRRRGKIRMTTTMVLTLWSFLESINEAGPGKIKWYATNLFALTRYYVDLAQEPKPRDIEYKFAIFSAKEIKKSKSSRIPATEVVVLKSNVSWATLKTNILTQINEALDPPSLIFHDYNITFTVPRQVSNPMQLSDKKYDYLVKEALQIQKNPSVKVIIEQKGFCQGNPRPGHPVHVR